MDSIAEALTGSWHLHPPNEALIFLSAAVYAKGGWRLHHRRPDYFTFRNLLCFFAGEIALFVAIASPLHELAEISLMAHMIQHVLLMMVIPPLILLGAPHLVFLFGLPDGYVRTRAAFGVLARRRTYLFSRHRPFVLVACDSAVAEPRAMAALGDDSVSIPR
jgi:cytochrome c oxidase assembly factor CtaG